MIKYFKVLDTYPLEGIDDIRGITNHYMERSNRVFNVRYGIKPVQAFIVDKHHENGLEIHAIYSDGTIKIFNYRTKRLIAVLFGRVQQIIRYYQDMGLSLPYDVLCEAQKNEELGRNRL